MPGLDFEDKVDISGDPPPARGLTNQEVAQAQKAQANQKKQGAQVPQAAPSRGVPFGGKPPGDKPDKPQDGKGDPSQQDGQGQQPAKGVQPALQALIGGIQQITNDPEWHEHPLLHFLTGGADPKSLPQDAWQATQWWGRVLNAFYDPNALHASAANIAADDSQSGKILQSLSGINKQDEWLWNITPYVVTAAFEWEPWIWGPQLAASGPGKLQDIPGAVMGLFGQDLKHPQFEDPNWYARMGSYALAAVIATKTGGKGVAPLLKFSGRLKVLEPFVAKADRFLGGPGDKTPIKGPDGELYDPAADPKGHSYAQWWNDTIAPLAEAETTIGKAAAKAGSTLVEHPDIEGAYKKVPLDPEAKADFARILGLPPTALPQEVKDAFFAMAENRELTPAMSAKIVKGWERLGPAVGMMGKIHYWHGGEAPYRNVLDALGRIVEPERKAAAESAMRFANGLRADLWKGVHGYGNNLAEAMVKGILNHGRSSDFYLPKVAAALKKVLPTAAERERVSKAVEAANLSPEEGEAAYAALTEHEKWAVDFYRRLVGEVRSAKLAHGVALEALPNFFYRVPKRIASLESALKGLPDSIKQEARGARTRTPFTYVGKQHRAFQIVGSPEGELRAEAAYPTTAAANAARKVWREQIKEDLQMRAVAADDPALAAIVNDPAKLEALAYAELPDFSTDIIDSLLGSGDRGFGPDMRSLFTHQVMNTLKTTLVLNDKDGRWHPMAVARNEAGQESSPTLSEHFKQLHDADTTTDFYKGEGWKAIEGFGAGHIFHPSVADPLNTAIKFGKGDSDAVMKFLRRASGIGKKYIMLNPLWHTTNMAGRFAWLTASHPQALANALFKARGIGKELKAEEGQQWWDMQEHEAIEHGLLPPQLNDDVVSSAGKYHTLASGDIETGQPLDVKQAITGFAHDPNLATGLNAVKGVDAWWQNHVNGHMWNQIHNFGVLAYIALKDDAIHRGMGEGDARIYAASQANAWAGMVSPDRWMNSPSMHNLSQLLLFAPNWWRTFPRIMLNSYDRLGMKSSPALTHAWALNAAKTVGMMILLKGATDNGLNWLMSGHWQFQNPDGYKNQITMDRFGGVDAKTGAHMVMEDPFERQTTDLERALGLEEAINRGYWKPEFAEQGSAEVIAARASPLLQALETASNFDLYNTFKNRALRWVDPQHPYPLGSAQALLAGVLNLSPVGYAAQSGLQGATAQPQTLSWGPFAGTQIPGWAARAFDPNDPLSPLLSLLGVRGGYPSPVKSEGAGLSSSDIQKVAQINNDWNAQIAKHQAAVMSGGETFSDFAYWYRQNASYHAGELAGITKNTSDYMNGTEGLLSRYEAIYNDKQAFDANGDINWAYITQKQDQLQAQTDPATWRQMMALKNQRAMQYPVLRAYEDSLQNYHNFQDTWAKQNGIDGETLRNLIGQGAGAPNYQQFEAQHPELARWNLAKRQWELESKQGFAYGLFTNNTYVMRVISPSGDPTQTAKLEDQVLTQIEAMEKGGDFVTPTGQ